MSKEVVFVFTRYNYDSYMDFHSLVKLSGYKTCYVDEVNISKKDTVYITSPINGEWRPHLDNHLHQPRNAHLILWQLERPASEGGSVGGYGKAQRELIYERYFDEVWVSDQQLANETLTRFVPLGSHKKLGNPGAINDKRFNAVHMSYINPRRENVYRHIKKLAPNAWGDRRDQVLKQSRFAINIHQDQYPFCEPLRIALFAAYGLPIISERIKNAEPYHDKIIWQDYDEVQTRLEDLLHNYEKWYHWGKELHEHLCIENNFRKWVDKAIFEDGVWR